MAFATGTATNFVDLYNKLRDFLTTNTTLVAAGQEWEQIGGNTGTLTDTDEIVLKGPGTSGTDEILVGLKPFVSVGSDYYNLSLVGLTAYNPAENLTNQVARSRFRMIHCWNSGMTYWFVANGRRFIVVVRVASVYQSAYGGFILPYVLPTQYPYPMYVAGVSEQPTYRYSQTGNDVSAFFSPGQSTASLCFPDSRWLEVYDRAVNTNAINDGSNENYNNSAPQRRVRPFCPLADDTPIRELLGGDYSLAPAVIECTTPYAAQMGALEGVFRVSGFSNAAENIITVAGIDYLVVPNVYRVTWADFAAIKLE